MAEFLWRALLAGLGVALVAGPLGCFVVWRRMAYFGDTLAHTALLGVVLGLALGLAPMIGVVMTGLAAAAVLVGLQDERRLAGDTVLGILSHGSLAVGLVAVAFMPGVRVDLMAYLFGDILAVDRTDLAMVWGGGGVVLTVLAWMWRPLLAVTVHEELARVEGRDVAKLRLLFMMLMAAVVAVAMKIVGILLVTALLVLPAATARRFARTPEGMAVTAALCGFVSVALGLAGSALADTPSGPSIVVASLVLFVVSRLKPA